MKERTLTILMITAVLLMGLIILTLSIGIYKASKESYCNSLELAEYFENKECRRIIER